MFQINEKFKPLFLDDSRYFVLTGGRGSMKSFSVTTFLLLLTYENEQTILFTRYTLTSADISIIPEFIEKIELANLENDFAITKNEIINLKTGSKILFKGIKTSSGTQTASLKSISGVTTWVLDEAEELTDEETFDKIDFSIRHKSKQNRVILILNPTTKEHFIYKKFFEERGVNAGSNTQKEDTTYIHTTYLDGKEFLNESFLRQAEETRVKNPRKYEHVLLGGWLEKAEGVIFTNWKIGNFVENDYVGFGQDFGFSIDPTTLVKVSIDKKNKRIYAKEYLYKAGLTTSQIAEENKRYCQNKLIIADSAEPRLIAELKISGCNIKPIEKPKITDSIALLQDYELIIDADSTNLIKELNNYSWHDKKSEVPIDDFNHCFVGSTLITTDKGLVPLKEIKEGDLVLTSKGFKRVLKKFNNGLKQVNKYTMQIDTFSVSLCSTKEHKIKSTTWKKISELQSGMMVYQHRNSMERILNCTQGNTIFHEAQKECTSKFGNQLTEKRQKGFIYTIKTEIHGITQLITSSVLRGKNTYQFTEKKGLKIIQSLLNTFNQKALKKQKTGINLKKVDYGILNTERGHGKIENIKNINANNAEVNLNHDTEELLSFAITTAKLKHFDIGESWSEEVYDIMVEDCHEYFANGILVHNCVDALRYVVWNFIGATNKSSYYIG